MPQAQTTEAAVGLIAQIAQSLGYPVIIIELIIIGLLVILLLVVVFAVLAIVITGMAIFGLGNE